MQQGMEAAAERSDEITTLRETVAALEAKLNDICKAKSGLSERKPPGRPKGSR